MPSRVRRSAILIGAIRILLPLLRVELDDIIPPARAVLAQDQSLGRGAGGVQVEPITGSLPGAQESHSHHRRRLPLRFDLRRPFAVLRAPVTQVFGVVVMIAALS